jgi:hypothetical protein
MEHLFSLFKCGYLTEDNKNNLIIFRISNFENIYLKIIPFFKLYNIVGEKYKDFEDFCKVAELIKNKAHLTKEGLDEIILIKSGMNKSRYFEPGYPPIKATIV